MEPDRIKELLEKYWQAETSLAEEAELKEYFAANPDDPNNPAAALFKYFDEEQRITMPESLNEPAKEHRIKWMSPLLKVAAILLIVFSVVYIWLPKQKTPPVAATQSDTYDDPEKAYLETKRALLLIAHHLNEGKSYMTEIKKINKAEQLINTTDKK
jgi:hypothetical protein